MTEPVNRIKGKLILVTGASSGIGEACARRFALTRGDPDTNVPGYDLSGRS